MGSSQLVFYLSEDEDAVAKCCEALLREICGSLGAEYFAASVVSDDRASQALDVEAWEAVVCEALEATAGAAGSDGDDTAELAAAAVHALRQVKLLSPRFRAGAAVVALLDEDREWHAATVSAVSGRGEHELVQLRFVEYDKPQLTAPASIRDGADVVDGDAEDGPCALCDRTVALTFHHLIPKETHDRFAGRLTADLLPKEARKQPRLTRAFLLGWGISVCSPCHRAIHDFASNATLARNFATLETLKADPAMRKWAAFVAKQRSTFR
ncbi:hypothetical protein M885DRAFT_510169 [Pelagophyceae sp. CCMP2097]|nr:hypothetical protein M885DRAFT_510169 [Pelagophyceae sp. CCMP2097]